MLTLGSAPSARDSSLGLVEAIIADHKQNDAEAHPQPGRERPLITPFAG
jgi:hypothetical protein